MAVVTGTFSGTGQSSSVVGKAVAIDMTFAGTATVAVQWLIDGTNWRTIESYTASEQIVVEAPNVPIRLSCAAHTNDVTYTLASIGA